MSARPVLFAFVLFACAVGSAALAFAQTAPNPAGKGAVTPQAAVVTTPIAFYLAHGEAEACGPGCDEWIAAEGKIDAGAAERFRALLKTLKDRRPPIYLHSPGGNISGALELGRLVHDRKFTVSVGYTVPLDCSSDKQSDKSCEAQKRAGKPVEAEISPTLAQCNSACVYVLAGGATHLVPPGVKLGIHDAGLDPNAKAPNGIQLAVGLQLAHTRVRSYLRAMGMTDALFTATLATPYESVKLLQRDDLVRFGLDPREFGETVWQFADKPTWYINKRFFVRSDGDQPRYIDATVNVVCNAALGMHVVFTRTRLGSDPDVPSAGAPTATITIGGKPVNLGRAASPSLYVRTGWLKLNTLDAVGDDATIVVPGTELGRKDQGDVTLNMDGFSAAYAKLKPHCSGTANNATAAWLARLPQTQTRAQSPAFPAVGGQAAALPSNWPVQSKGAVASAQSRPSADAAATPADGTQTLELARVVTAAERARLDFLTHVWVDCSSSQVEAGITEQPQHGAVTIQGGQEFPDFPKDDPLVTCNTRKAYGKFVYYQPNADYHGTDSLTIRVLSASGHPEKRHYSIDVK